MNTNETFLVAGGDLRQVYSAEMLAEKGYQIYVTGFDKNIAFSDKIITVDNLMTMLASDRVDYIVLPLPVSHDGIMLNTPFSKQNISLNTLTSLIKDNGTVFGGKFSESAKKIFTDKNITTVDYIDREELNILNAVPTAEGAVQIAMEELATTIFGQNVLVTGFGRISKVLIEILKGFGADITVAARKYSDLAWAEVTGCSGIHISKLDEYIDSFDIIFNTVPAVIIDKKILSKTKKDVLIIDLASKPGGIDFDSAASLGRKVIWALSLPGKVAPISSGEIIAYTILNILNERRYADD